MRRTGKMKRRGPRAGDVAAVVVAGGLAALGPGTPAAAQDAVELERTARFPDGFGFVQTVRPMPDGRVLVADPLGRILAFVDLDAGTLEAVGREGPGPEEWRQPDAVYPLPGDSTLLVDLGNTRLAVLDPSGEIVRGHRMVLETGERGPMGLEISNPGGTDARGRVYYQARGGMRPPSMEMDSSTVKRWTPDAGEPVVLAKLSPPPVEMTRSGSGGETRMMMREIPLAPQDAWAVADDGAVAVVRADPYRVEWIRPDGQVVRGPAVAYRPVRVRNAERERYLDERQNTGLSARMTVENGVRSLGLSRGGQGGDEQARARELRELEWPESLPAFRPDGALVGPDGQLWVERYTAAGDPARYDLFDRSGRRVGAIRLPAGRRIIGFDGDRVYAVAVDDLGLHWLEAYR